MRTTARSVRGSVCTTSAGSSLSESGIFTVRRVALATTCEFVNTMPSLRMMTPEPEERNGRCPPRGLAASTPRAEMETMAGATFAWTARNASCVCSSACVAVSGGAANPAPVSSATSSTPITDSC
ncbi:MAG: hypothetical protein BWY76_02759 [bacterium ADurb.Bin429]|nr:MAG: hypothetical protein BWY76_02759 [bacterium ADurb.Bin429]